VAMGLPRPLVWRCRRRFSGKPMLKRQSGRHGFRRLLDVSTFRARCIRRFALAQTEPPALGAADCWEHIPSAHTSSWPVTNIPSTSNAEHAICSTHTPTASQVHHRCTRSRRVSLAHTGDCADVGTQSPAGSHKNRRVHQRIREKATKVLSSSSCSSSADGSHLSLVAPSREVGRSQEGVNRGASHPRQTGIKKNDTNKNKPRFAPSGLLA